MPRFARALALSTALLAAAPAAGEAAAFDIARCEHLLGDGYDALEPAAKAARLTAFGGCWKRRADSTINHSYRKILQQVDNFHFYGRRQAHDQIAAKAATAKDVLKVRHRTELDSLKQRFDSEFRALAMNPGDDDYAANKRRGEINQRRKAEGAALQARQRQESAALHRDIRQSNLMVDEELATAVHDDKANLARQRIAQGRETERLYNLVLNPDGLLDGGDSVVPYGGMIGRIQAIHGKVTITGADGQSMTATVGTPVFQGDAVETSMDGAAKIEFIDETSFAVSEDARLVVDEHVFDPSARSDASDFSFLKAIFVFTSGLIGRDDRDDIEVDTPVGAIGIRG